MLWVVKIGGSLYRSKDLPKWLNAIGNHTTHNIVIVPGGGPFADLVRKVDKEFNLEQARVHDMAVLAMQQYAHMMASICPKLQLVASLEEIHNNWEQGKALIWEPYQMVRQDCELEKSWQITSDSLAAWLAKYLSANYLLFVKSTEITLLNKSISELIAQGCLDSNINELFTNINCSVEVLHKSKINQFMDQLTDN